MTPTISNLKLDDEASIDIFEFMIALKHFAF